MKHYIMGIMLALSSSAVMAHEMVPTYPKLEPSHLDSVYKTEVQLFNKRADVEYYEIGVFDKDFKPIPFVTSYKIVKIKYLGKVSLEVYVRKSDVSRATYVCSQSKLRKDGNTRTVISSRICSKFK